MPRGYTQFGGATDKMIEGYLLQTEKNIMSDVIRRVKKAGKITSSADYALNRMLILGNSSQDVERLIQAGTGKTQAAMSSLLSRAASEAYTRDRDLYTQTGKAQIPFADNQELQQIIRGIINNSNSTLTNITGSAGFVLPNSSGVKRFLPMYQVYNQYLDQAIFEMASGAFDYNTLIRRVVSDLTASGLRSVDYASGKSNRVDVAVRRAILTAYGQITSQVAFSNAQALGTDLFEVTWHPDARPEHQAWQGKVYTRKELYSVCGYGTVTGLCGANCRHTFYPYIPNVSKPSYTAQEVRKMNAEENKPKTYKGKTYTDYEATQRMRRLETTMRAQLERAELLKLGAAADADLTAVLVRYRATSAEYSAFASAFGLPEQRERVYTRRRRRGKA